MKDILQEILQHKQLEVDALLQAKDVSGNIIEHALNLLKAQKGKKHSMAESLMYSNTGIIAEFKRKSPSKGWINEQAQVDIIPPGYAQAGASAISVLTDHDYFGGCDEFLERTRALTNIPLLRKDFIIHPIQVYQAKILGADAILLIAAGLEYNTCKELAALAHSLGLEVLLEVHNPSELKYIDCKPDMVGVNNRHLGSFVTDGKQSIELAKELPRDKVWVSESGLSNAATICELRALGYRGFLMGESFMRTANPAHALAQLIKEIEQHEA